MAAGLGNAVFGQHQNTLGILDCGEAMRNDKGGAVLCKFLQ